MTQSENKFIDGQFINGQWHAGQGHELESLNPATDEPLWQAKSATVEQVNDDVLAARAAFLPWADKTVEERLAIANKYAELLGEYKEQLALAIAMETGKPLWETRTEIGAMIGKVAISEKAYRIYKAAFDRTPDEEGLGYWIQELDKGFALHQVTNSFVISQEFKNLYGADLNNEGFITALYNNVLDRDPDQGGLDYWINDMENNGMSRADVLASFSESAENIANTDPLIELGVLYQPYDLLG